MQLSQIDLSDIQALAKYGHGHLQAASFHLLKIKNKRAARKWLASVNVAGAGEIAPPETATQVAFTCSGLIRLGVPKSIIDQFSHEFRTGMHEADRARRLGDVGDNNSENWYWGSGKKLPDLMVMLYARVGELEKLQKSKFNTL